MIAFENGVIATEYHSTSESAIEAGKEAVKRLVFPYSAIGVRIDFSDGTSAHYNNVQQSDCLKFK